MKDVFKIGERVIFDHKQAVICHFITSEGNFYIAETRFSSIFLLEAKVQITVATDLLSK